MGRILILICTVMVCLIALSLSLLPPSLSLSPSISVASLKSQLHRANSVSPQDLYLVLPGGKTPMDSDLAVSCLQSWNIGTMYAFTTAVDPSFKMIHSTNSSVTRLSKYRIVGKFGGLVVYLCNCQIEIHQYFILAYNNTCTCADPLPNFNLNSPIFLQHDMEHI